MLLRRKSHPQPNQVSRVKHSCRFGVNYSGRDTGRAFVFLYQHGFPELRCGFYVADWCDGTGVQHQGRSQDSASYSRA